MEAKVATKADLAGKVAQAVMKVVRVIKIFTNTQACIKLSIPPP